MLILTEKWKLRPKHNLYSKLIRKGCKVAVRLTEPRTFIPDNQILLKVEKEKKLTLQIRFGGLGDHLIYSSLPELLWKQKGIRTFISNYSIVRSKEIADFVWGTNPYVTIINKKGWFINQKTKEGFVGNEYLEKLFELDGTGCPKLYYKPNLIEQLKGKAIVDPSFGPSGRANGYYEKDIPERFAAYLGENVGDFILIIHEHVKAKNDLELHLKQVFKPSCYPVNTLEGYADVLFSAGRRYITYSGGASLSAGLGLESFVLCNRKPRPHFMYAINKYIELQKTK